MYGIGLSNFGKPIFLKVRNNYNSFIQLNGTIVKDHKPNSSF